MEVAAETSKEPVPLTRQAVVPHHDPFGEPCPKVSVVQVYTFVPMKEIVRVKATCSRCGWIGLRVVPSPD